MPGSWKAAPACSTRCNGGRCGAPTFWEATSFVGRDVTPGFVAAEARENKQFVASLVRRQQETPQIGRLLLLYVDDTVVDETLFGDVRQRAFNIMSKDALLSAGQRLSMKSASMMNLRWQAVDGLAGRTRRHRARSMQFSTFPPPQRIALG